MKSVLTQGSTLSALSSNASAAADKRYSIRLYTAISGVKSELWSGILLGIAALAVIVLFTLAALLIHWNIDTSAYDLGIFDQAFWKYSRWDGTFNTVRGMSILGDHFSVISLIFGPLYRIYPDVFWPLAAQTLSVAAGGVILYMIVGRKQPRKPWLALAFALSYFLNPDVHNTLLWQYHELVLASGLYLGLIYTYQQNRWKTFMVLVMLLLFCREDMPFTVGAFGLLALYEKRWRFGFLALAAAVVWWWFATRVAMPYFNGQGYFRQTYGTLATPLANIFNPAFYVERLSSAQTLYYLWQLFFPVGFLALFAPRYLFPALPTLAANILIGGYNTNIDYHYTVSIMPFIFWAALHGYGRLDGIIARHGRISHQKIGAGVAAALFLGALFGYQEYSVLNLHLFPNRFADMHNNAAKVKMLSDLSAEFGDKGVAATDYLLPHLSHRDKIYLFPNPWQTSYWGIAGENPQTPNNVDYIVLTHDDFGKNAALLDYLLDAGVFVQRRDQNGIVVLKRAKLEANDRVQALADMARFNVANQFPFDDVMLSKAYPTTEQEFKRLDVDIHELQKETPAGWTNAHWKAGRLLDIDLLQPHQDNDFHTRYVRTTVTSSESENIWMLLGSDDGVTVWLNGSKVYENIVYRPARLGDDRIAMKFEKGKNVLVFRVNNGGGAWRLLAKLMPRRWKH